ncbi:MAG: hypothetical protein IPP65_00470 [Chlorobi bacterium]|nr:hypothetical protein [Chlorobiota bacterium]
MELNQKYNVQILLLILLFVFYLTGCDLFSTRPAEPPSGKSSDFEQPLNPTIVLKNIQSSFIYANASDNKRCFSSGNDNLPPYIFYPSSQGFAASPGKFSNWGIEQEEAYLKNVFSQLQLNGVCSITFSPDEVNEISVGDSVLFTTSDQIKIPHTRSDAERESSGIAQFVFKRSARNEWMITSFRDFSQVDKTSWSLIKARFIDF